MSQAVESGEASTVSLAGPGATMAFAARLAPVLRAGDVIALSGALGMGKTTFARGLIYALAAAHGQPREDVPSPTFTLVQTYPFPPFVVYHIDLYRIERPEDALELGIEEAFADGVSLIEWPERLGPYLPADRLEIVFLPGVAGAGEDVRTLRIDAPGGWRVRIAEARTHG